MRTSNYASIFVRGEESLIRNIKVPLSISQATPEWYVGPRYLALAPPWPLIRRAHQGCSYEEYRDAYNKQVLRYQDPKKCYDEIVGWYGDDVVLLCYEDLTKPGEWCHRRIVAEWFEHHLGIEVPEWTPPIKTRTTLSF